MQRLLLVVSGIACVALAAFFAVRTISARSPVVIAMLASFIVNGLLGAIHRRAIAVWASSAILAAAAAFCVFWVTRNVLGAGWPEVKLFSSSPWMVLASTIVFGAIAWIDLGREPQSKGAGREASSDP